MAQQYIHDDEEEAFAIFCMNNFDEPIHHESPENQQPNEPSTTKQVQYFYHRDILDEQTQKILFVMINSMQHMHLKHDITSCESENMDVFRLEKSFERFQNPKLNIH